MEKSISRDDIVLTIRMEFMRLEIKFRKTKPMAICAGDHSDLRIYYQTCTKVDIFKYFGRYLDSSGSSKIYVQANIEQA